MKKYINRFPDYEEIPPYLHDDNVYHRAKYWLLYYEAAEPEVVALYSGGPNEPTGMWEEGLEIEESTLYPHPFMVIGPLETPHEIVSWFNIREENISGDSCIWGKTVRTFNDGKNALNVIRGARGVDCLLILWDTKTKEELLITDRTSEKDRFIESNGWTPDNANEWR